VTTVTLSYSGAGLRNSVIILTLSVRLLLSSINPPVSYNDQRCKVNQRRFKREIKQIVFLDHLTMRLTVFNGCRPPVFTSTKAGLCDHHVGYFACRYVCLCGAVSRKKLCMNLHEIFIKGKSWPIFIIFIFILWGGTRSLRMPTLRLASQAGQMRNPQGRD